MGNFIHVISCSRLSWPPWSVSWLGPGNNSGPGLGNNVPLARCYMFWPTSLLGHIYSLHCLHLLHCHKFPPETRSLLDNCFRLMVNISTRTLSCSQWSTPPSARGRTLPWRHPRTPPTTRSCILNLIFCTNCIVGKGGVQGSEGGIGCKPWKGDKSITNGNCLFVCLDVQSNRKQQIRTSQRNIKC